MLSMTAFCVD
jgi:hypothetical protein